MTSLSNTLFFILKGSFITIQLFFITTLFSVPLGILAAIGKISTYKPVQLFLNTYTWIFRGTPLLLQLFFVYYGLPVLGITFSPLMAASITFILNYTAYLTEIFRSAIQSIEKGQYEAAKVLGLNSFHTFLRVILPQALRRVIGPCSNEFISLLKDTALIAAIGMGDLLRAAKEIVTRDFTVVPFLLAALVYLFFTSLIILFFKKIETQYRIVE